MDKNNLYVKLTFRLMCLICLRLRFLPLLRTYAIFAEERCSKVGSQVRQLLNNSQKPFALEDEIFKGGDFFVPP